MTHVKALSLQACELWAFDMHILQWYRTISQWCKSTTMIDLHIFLIVTRRLPSILYYIMFLLVGSICHMPWHSCNFDWQLAALYEEVGHIFAWRDNQPNVSLLKESKGWIVDYISIDTLYQTNNLSDWDSSSPCEFNILPSHVNIIAMVQPIIVEVT